VSALRFRGVDLCAPETHDEPWELYDYLRDNDPLYWDEHNELWYAFRYDDVLAISRDPATFCSTEGNRPNLPADPSMIHQDGTAHAKQRGLVAKGFTPRAMKDIEASCVDTVNALMAAFLERGSFDAVEDLAAQLPAQIVATMLGVPHDMTPTLRRWIEVMVSGGQGPNYVDDTVNDAFGEFCEHHEMMVAEREGNDDLLLRWMHAELNGEKLEEDQLLFEHALILAGGIETTRNAIAGGLEMLAQDPEAWAYLRANVDDARVINAAAEEMIRWVTPFTNMFRTATRDVELRGQTIREGQMVGLMYPAANRDPSVFTDPHRFDVRRDPRAEKHLAFGFGTHFCLGANLARLELETTLVALLRKMKTLSFAPDGRRERLSSSFIRGLAHLDLTFTLA
jgi:cytochrome P450 family 142 subfamily A polypeptide 1